MVRDGELRAYGKVLSEASPFFEKLLNSNKTEGKYLFYFPREDRWYKKEPIYLQSDDGIFFCRNKMYGTRRKPSNASYSRKLRIFCYNPHSCRWKFLPPLNDGLVLKKLFVYNDEMYALFLRHKGPPVMTSSGRLDAA